MADDRKIEGALDLISNLPDEILQQHILCFIPTKISISTSLLSRRWRHVWCEVPSLSLDVDTLTAALVNETLTRYTAPKTKSFHLIITPITKENIPYIDRWIKWAVSHNVESLSLHLWRSHFEYEFPDFFCNSSSVKQLNINLGFSHMIVPECTISWTSLQKLSLTRCGLSDESMSKILSGCPILENLTLHDCGLNVLDLSKFLRLRTLEVQVQSNAWCEGPRQIVAPHIHCLRLHDSWLSCTLVDVASLVEAHLEISCVSNCSTDYTSYIQLMGVKMLEKLHNVETLTFGGKFIQLLSLAEIVGDPCILNTAGVPFPMLKVKVLTLDIKICQYVIPGIERLLQNSPYLEKLTLRGRTRFQVPEEFAGNYLEFKGFNVNKCWRSKDGASWNKCCEDLKSEHVSSLVELVLKNTEKLDKLVVLLDERYLKFKIEEVLVPTLPHNNNVTIVLSTTNLMPLKWWNES